MHAQANSYQAKVAELNAQNVALQTQIRLSQANYAKVSGQVAAAQAKMESQKQTLGANLKSMYLDSGVTPLEMIASSNDLSDYFNQQQYKDSIKSKIQSSLASIQALKLQLEAQQKNLATLLADQRNQQAQVAANQAEVARLAAIASSNAAAADQQVQASNSEITKLKAQQAAELAARFAAASGGRGIISAGSCGGGYPDRWCGAAQDTIIDSWGMYNRECVSYTAYKVYASGRNMPYWGGHGNAKEWPGNARAAGIPVDGNPHVGDVAISTAGPYGHAMYVEAVSGGKITVSQYNFNNDGNYSMMTVSSAGLYFLHF